VFSAKMKVGRRWAAAEAPSLGIELIRNLAKTEENWRHNSTKLGLFLYYSLLDVHCLLIQMEDHKT
jgi:hypothetical protein